MLMKKDDCPTFTPPIAALMPSSILIFESPLKPGPPLACKKIKTKMKIIFEIFHKLKV